MKTPRSKLRGISRGGSPILLFFLRRPIRIPGEADSGRILELACFLADHTPFGNKVQIRIKLLNPLIDGVDHEHKPIGVLDHRHRAIELPVSFSQLTNNVEALSLTGK